MLLHKKKHPFKTKITDYLKFRDAQEVKQSENAQGILPVKKIKRNPLEE